MATPLQELPRLTNSRAFARPRFEVKDSRDHSTLNKVDLPVMAPKDKKAKLPKKWQKKAAIVSGTA